MPGAAENWAQYLPEFFSVPGPVLFPGPIFSGTVTGKKEQNSRDRDVTL